MPNIFHKDFVDDDNHAVSARTYADIAARDADSTFQVNANIDKIVRVNDSPIAYYVLISLGPATWQELTNSEIDSFIKHSDTPASYSGEAGKVLQVNVAETDVEFGQPLRTTDDPTFRDLVLTGDLTVQGTTVTFDAETLLIEDKNIELGTVPTPTDVTADGGGITLKGTTDKTIIWSNATDSWTLNQQLDVGTNKIINVVDPTNVQDAATKNYVDSLDAVNVKGPASATDNAFSLFDGTTGKLVKNSALTVSGTDLLFATNFLLGDQLSVGSLTSPATDASIDLKATNKALLHNRLTEVQRDTLTPLEGMVVYNTDTTDVEFFNGVVWQSMSGGDVVGPSSSLDNAVVRFNSTSGKVIQNNNNVFIDDGGNLGIGIQNPLALVHVSSASPAYAWTETDQPVDGKNWFLAPEGGKLVGFVANDANNASAQWISVERNLNSIVEVLFPSDVRGTGKFTTGGGRLKSAATFNSSSGTNILGIKEVYYCTSIVGDIAFTIASTHIALGGGNNVLDFIIKDATGDLVSNGFKITIDTEGSETIDGQASIDINADYGVVRLFSDGSDLFSY